MWNEIQLLHPKLLPSKTSSRLAIVQGSNLSNFGKIQLLLVLTRTTEQNKLFIKAFKQTYIKHNIIGTPFNTKNFPRIEILNSKLHIKDKYTSLKNKSLTFFQRLKKNLHFSPIFILYTIKNENARNHYQDMYTTSQ